MTHEFGKARSPAVWIVLLASMLVAFSPGAAWSSDFKAIVDQVISADDLPGFRINTYTTRDDETRSQRSFLNEERTYVDVIVAGLWETPEDAFDELIKEQPFFAERNNRVKNLGIGLFSVAYETEFLGNISTQTVAAIYAEHKVIVAVKRTQKPFAQEQRFKDLAMQVAQLVNRRFSALSDDADDEIAAVQSQTPETDPLKSSATSQTDVASQMNRYFSAFVDGLDEESSSDGAVQRTQRVLEAVLEDFPSGLAIAQYLETKTSCESAATDPVINCMRLFSDIVFVALNDFPEDLPDMIDVALAELQKATPLPEVDGSNGQTTSQTASLAIDAPMPQGTSLADDIEAWQRAVRTDEPDQYKAYLQRFPNGQFAELATLRSQNAGSQ